MKNGVNSSVIGKWRITEADLWDRGYLDLVEPAYIAFGDQGYGDFAFGCVTGGMECEYSPSIIFFTWDGMDEMDEVSGDGSAEISDDRTLEIEIRFRYGEEAILKARKW